MTTYTIDEIFSREFLPYFRAVGEILDGYPRNDLNELEFLCMASELSNNYFCLIPEFDNLRNKFFDYVYFENNALKKSDNPVAAYELFSKFKTPEDARKYYFNNILNVYELYMSRYEDNIDCRYKRKLLSTIIEELYSQN